MRTNNLFVKFVFLVLLFFSFLFITSTVQAQSCSGSHTTTGLFTCDTDFEGNAVCAYGASASAPCEYQTNYDQCMATHYGNHVCEVSGPNCVRVEWNEDGLTAQGCTTIRPTTPPVVTNTPRPPTSTSAPGQPTSTPAPTPTSGPPTPTPTTGGPCPGGQLGEGAYCLNAQQCCAPGLGCQTTVGLPGYGTCFREGDPSCFQARCNGASCSDYGYNPDYTRAPGDGCYKEDDYRCNITNGCQTPVPTLPIGTCSVSGPSQALVGNIYEVSMTKDQSGGYLLCGQPTIAPGSACQEYNYGPFSYCFDTNGCTGEVRATNTGTCTVTFNCTNSQNGAQVSCSKQIQQVNAPTATPTPWIQVDVQRTNGQPRNVAQICRANCTEASCNISNVCDEDVSTFTMRKNSIVNRRGGYISLSAPNGQPLVVVGVTPGAGSGGQYHADCKGEGGACYTWPAGSWTTGGRSVVFVVATPTPTPTPLPTATPTPAPWEKLKNASFQSDDALNIALPGVPLAYDADDSGAANFILPEGGMVSVQSSSLSPSELSSKGWYNQSNPSIVQSKSSFLAYVKARKGYTKLTTLSGNLSEITQNGIYYYDPSGTFTITTDYATPNVDFVLIVDGPVAFNVSNGVFNVNTASSTLPSRRSVAIVADSINFYTGTNFMTNANGVFIANSVNTGSANNLGLKIVGNLITQSLTNGRNRNNTTNRAPSLFVVNDMKQYITLLPYLSVSKYDWKQLQ